jgi:hypothetical protein
MHAGREADLVGVDATDPTHEVLVEKRLLERDHTASEPPGECDGIEVGVERVEGQLGQKPVVWRDADPAEGPHVVVNEVFPIIKFEPSTGVLTRYWLSPELIGAGEGQPTGHPEVEQDAGSTLEREVHLLAAPLDAENPLAARRGFELHDTGLHDARQPRSTPRDAPADEDGC